MASPTTSNTRTLTAYAATLLEHPRWVIGREVDFTYCRHHGEFDAGIAECVNCRFHTACKWLTEHQGQCTATAPLDGLVAALRASVEYFHETRQHGRGCACETCAWLHHARQFLRNCPQPT